MMALEVAAGLSTPWQFNSLAAGPSRPWNEAERTWRLKAARHGTGPDNRGGAGTLNAIPQSIADIGDGVLYLVLRNSYKS